MKKTYNQANLTCTLQEDSEVRDDKVYLMALWRKETDFEAEELAHSPKIHTRNPKLYDGTYISLIRKTDGKLQFSFKTKNPEGDFKEYAKLVYREILKAQNHIAL